MQDSKWKTESMGRIQELLLDMEELINNSKRIPFTDTIVMNDVQMIHLMSDLQDALPVEFGEVEKLLEERQRIIADAKAEAQDLIEKARAYGEKLVQEHHIMQQANERAGKILKQSQEESLELQRNSYKYAEDVFSRLEESLDRALNVVRQGKTNIRPSQDSLEPSDLD